MKKIKTVLVLCICLFNCKNTTNAQSSPENVINLFFNKFEKEGVNPALDYLYSTNLNTKVIESEISNMKSKLSITIDKLGKYHGYEYIVKKSIGNSFVLYSYMIKYDRQPIRFTFILYKPEKEWILYGFIYDANLDDELKEAAKAYRLSENLPLFPPTK